MRPFDHPDWLFELKYDGFRALAYVTPKGCELILAQGQRWYTVCRYRECARMRGILDGEIVHLDADSKSQFYRLLCHPSPQYLVAFDLLWHSRNGCILHLSYPVSCIIES